MALTTEDKVILTVAALGIGAGILLLTKKSEASTQRRSNLPTPPGAPPPNSTSAARTALAANPAAAASPASPTNPLPRTAQTGNDASPPPPVPNPEAESLPLIDPPRQGANKSMSELTPSEMIRYKVTLKNVTGGDVGPLNSSITSQLRAEVRQFQVMWNDDNANRAQRLAPETLGVDGDLGPRTQTALEHFAGPHLDAEIQAAVGAQYGAGMGATVGRSGLVTPTSIGGHSTVDSQGGLSLRQPTGGLGSSFTDQMRDWMGSSTSEGGAVDTGPPPGQIQIVAPPGMTATQRSPMFVRCILQGLNYNVARLSLDTFATEEWQSALLTFQSSYNSENEAREQRERRSFRPARLDADGQIGPNTFSALGHYLRFASPSCTG